MGSECSVYKDYELEEPIESSNSEWTLYPAHSKASNSPVKRVTVFVHTKSKSERKQATSGLTNSSQVHFPYSFSSLRKNQHGELSVVCCKILNVVWSKDTAPQASSFKPYSV
jgi:hypothetical protein